MQAPPWCPPGFDVTEMPRRRSEFFPCAEDNKERAQHELKHRLRGLITTMDALTLHTQGIEFFRGSHELFRCALLHSVDYVGLEEMMHWEQVLQDFDSGCLGLVTPSFFEALQAGQSLHGSEQEPPPAEADADGDLLWDSQHAEADTDGGRGETAPRRRGSGSCPQQCCEGTSTDGGSGSPNSSAGGSRPLSSTCSSTCRTRRSSRSSHRSARRQPPRPRVSLAEVAAAAAAAAGFCAEQIENEVLPRRLCLSAAERYARLVAARASVAVAAASSGRPCHGLQGYALRARAAHCATSRHFVSGASTPCSKGQWLAMQQELRMKDFVVQQLERQLGFERGCDKWLATESTSMERRREQLGFCAAECEGAFDRSRQVLACMAANSEIEVESKRTEDTYVTRNEGWWHSEAEFVKALYQRVEVQSTADLSDMSERDRVAYHEYIQPLVQKLVTTFNTRRFQAEQFREQRLRALQQHHEDLLRRHMSSAMSVHKGSDTAEGLETASGLPGLTWNVHLDEPEASSVDFVLDAFEFQDEGGDFFSEDSASSQASRTTRATCLSEANSSDDSRGDFLSEGEASI